MSETGLSRLRQLISERYDQLRAQVAHRLGSSSDLAADALHEAYLRMAARDDLDQVRYPQTYLVNAAVNATIDQIRKEARLVSETEVNSLFELRYDGPGPERTVVGKDLVAHAMTILDALPPRQCALFIEHRAHGVDTAELAERWGISRAQVRREIQAANKACLKAMRAMDAEHDFTRHDE